MPKVSNEHKETKRKEILAAAMQVFIRDGYEATTMKDIVEASGKSFGGVYMYYSNKEHIFHELLEQTYREMSEHFSPAVNSTAWDELVRFMDNELTRASRAEAGLAPVMFEFFIAERRSETHKKLMQRRHQAVNESIRGLLQRGIDSGEFQPCVELDALAHVLVCYLDGVFLESIITGAERIQLEEQLKAWLELLKTALGKTA